MVNNNGNGKNVKVAAIQIEPSPDGLTATLNHTEELIRLSADKGAKVIALPQLFALPWFPATINTDNFNLAEDEDGETISFMRELSSKLDIAIVTPIFEKYKDKYFNTAFVTGPDGDVLGKYRKMHVPQIPLWEERSYFTPGDLGFTIIETPYAKIGIQLCWDVFFPEGMRILALNGADIVIAPTASAFEHSSSKWERAISASAHANGLFVMRVNRIGIEGEQSFYGRSFCAGPDGEFLVKPAGSLEGVIMAECDLNVIGTVRKDWVFMKDRRPDTYKTIIGE